MEKTVQVFSGIFVKIADVLFKKITNTLLALFLIERLLR